MITILFKSPAIHKRLRQLFVSISLMFLSIFVGMVGFVLLEDYDLWDAFYLTVITISTVGMNEVRNVSHEGRIFISFYIIFNFSVFAYFVSVITKYLFEGELRDIFQSYMEKKVTEKISDHTIVCGFGKNGSKTCEQLFNSKESFAVIEKHIEIVYDKFEGKQNVYFVEGDATSDEILIKAGINKAKTIITTLPKDADNVFVVLTARELNPDIKIIARAQEESSVSKLFRAGAHHVVQPDVIGGVHMANLVTRPEVVEFLRLLNGVGDSGLRLEELHFEEMKEEFHNKSIRELDIRNLTGMNIIGYKDSENGFIFNPHSDTVFDKGDVVIVLGTENQIKNFVDYFSDNKN